MVLIESMSVFVVREEYGDKALDNLKAKGTWTVKACSTSEACCFVLTVRVTNRSKSRQGAQHVQRRGVRKECHGESQHKA